MLSEPGSSLSSRIALRGGDQLFTASQEPLPVFLNALAAEFTAAVPGGSLILAVDQGMPLGFGTYGLEDPEVDRLYRHLEELCDEHRNGSEPRVDSPADASPVHALPLRHRQRLIGFLAQPWQLSEGPPPTSTALERLVPTLALAVATGVAAELWHRSERLQSLLHQTLQVGEPDRIRKRLEDLVEGLAELFGADVATVLLAADRELRLAASTDRHLGSGRPVVYRPGDGLTGWIFENRRGLRIDDTANHDEVREKTGILRTKARFAERDREGSMTGQYLGVPMRSADGVVGVIRISRRRGARRFTPGDESALQQFADLLGAGLSQSFRLQLANSILDSVHDGIAVSRRETADDGRSLTRLVHVNPGGERLLGGSQEDLIGRDAGAVYAPGEYDRIKPRLIRAIDDLKKGMPGECEPTRCVLRRLDGTSVPVVISFRVLADSRLRPPALYAVGVARDASESEEMAASYQRLLEFLDAVDVAYYRTDRHGRTVESTPAEQRITGYTKEELAAVGREILYPEPERRTRFLNLAREGHGRIVRMPLRLQNKSGDPIWVEGDLRILSNTEKETSVEVAGIYRDVTERMRLQEFLSEDTEALLSDHELFTRLKQDAEFHLDYLLSVGHQILTPLSSLAGTLRSFEEGLLGAEELRDRLPYISGQVRVCARLVRNLSFMDKILRDERFERRPQSLARLAIETKLDFDHQLKAKKLNLTIDDKSLDRLGPVEGDKELLRQVFVNLIDNAIKYSLSETTIHVHGHLWRTGRVVEISNRGLPLSKVNRERIFQRGFRTSYAKALVPHGTGLGLWLTRKILKAHGADIVCIDDPKAQGSRTVFRITFPHATTIHPRRKK